MLFLDFYLRRFQHHEELGNRFRHPLHIEVHHKALVAWWKRLEDSVNDRVIREIDSQLRKAVMQPRHSEHMLTS